MAIAGGVGTGLVLGWVAGAPGAGGRPPLLAAGLALAAAEIALVSSPGGALAFLAGAALAAGAHLGWRRRLTRRPGGGAG